MRERVTHPGASATLRRRSQATLRVRTSQEAKRSSFREEGWVDLSGAKRTSSGARKGGVLVIEGDGYEVRMKMKMEMKMKMNTKMDMNMNGMNE